MATEQSATADPSAEKPATAKKAARRKSGRKPGRPKGSRRGPGRPKASGRKPGRPKGARARRGPGRPRGKAAKAATASGSAGANGAFLVRVKQGRGWSEESQPSLASAHRRVLDLVFSGTAKERIEVYQKQQVKLSVDLAFSPVGAGAPAAASAGLAAPASRGPGRPANSGRGKGKRGRTTNLRELIRKTLADLGGSANVAEIKNKLWDSGKTGSGSPRSLYNSISQAIRRYKGDFALKGRGLVALK